MISNTAASLTGTSSVWSLPRELQRAGCDLLHQQCWCWGQDIRRPGGNLLLDYGFVRQRPAETTRGGSMYYQQCPCGRLTVLWGFGLFYGAADTGGLLLTRSEFGPRWLPALDLTTPPHQLADLHSCEPCNQRPAHTLLIEALGWISAYERWVQATQGHAYRQSCLDAWKHGRVPQLVPAEQLPEAWQRLAGVCAARALVV